MSAVLRPGPLRRVPMVAAHLDAVTALENAAYPFPWSRGNFIDSLIAGYLAEVLLDERGGLLAYGVAMKGVDEVHLLNLTVAPARQREGHGAALLESLVAHCRRLQAHRLWLEVRGSNGPARALYARRGFVQVGVRRGYYPAPLGRREDALVMQLTLEDGDALD